MKLVAALLVLFAIVCVAIADENYPTWEEYKAEYGKSYPNPTEDAMRKQIFEKNLKMIIEHNKRYAEGKETYEMGINPFVDWTQEEFRNRYN